MFLKTSSLLLVVRDAAQVTEIQWPTPGWVVLLFNRILSRPHSCYLFSEWALLWVRRGFKRAL